MKLVCFLADLDGGGAERTMLNLCTGLADEGYAPVLAAGRTDGPARQWLDPRIELVDMGASRARFALAPLRREVRKRSPDLLFATKLDANLVAAAAVALAPSIRRPRLILRETNSHRARQDIGLLKRLATGIAYRSADGVVALSQGVAEELAGDYDIEARRLVTIANPVDIEAVRRTAAEGETDLKAPLAGRLVVAAGRLTEQKGFDLLLPAFARHTGPHDTLVILGEGGQREALGQLANSLGIAQRVHFKGFVRHPEIWFSKADVFVLSSRWEGFGHVIVEAMASGTPVVSFDCPHGPRDIIQHGVNGLLVANGDVDGLGRAMHSVLSSPELARTLTQQAAGSIGRYGRRAITRAYLDLFHTVLGLPPRRHSVTNRAQY